ncbi:MAG: plastocyanin/azurin family copper-binding protein [Chloroflexota bacterium]
MKVLRAAIAVLPLLLAAVPTPAALADASNLSVAIGDGGFSPAIAKIPVGGTITWTNQGTNVHTATATPASNGNTISTPAPFDSGGLGPGQNFNWTFSLPGTYIYTSATDCLNGNITAGFPCTGNTVVVGTSSPNSIAQPAPPPTASLVPASVPAGTTVVQAAVVTISDTGFSPSTIAVTTGGTASTAGSVTFVNKGTNLHTAVSGAIQMDDQRNPPEVFDTGGLAPGDSKAFSFIYAGTYTFNSGPDCLNGSNNPNFNCGGPYTLRVIKAPVGATTGAVAPPFSGATVYFRDATAFDPGAITVKAGHTVTWLNLTTSVHSVVSDSAAQPFDSGGLGDGQTFSVTFQTPGTYKYHSSTEPIYSGSTITGYQNNGTVVVTP